MARIRHPVRRILSDEDEAKVVDAIRAAEARTSGEIRVHVEARSGGDPLGAARRWFVRLGMERTAARNGVLFYLAVRERAFAVLGDEGIHARVGAEFWDGVRDAMREAFSRGEFARGLVSGIEAAGSRLAEHFPRRDDDVNELPDEVSTS